MQMLDTERRIVVYSGAYRENFRLHHSQTCVGLWFGYGNRLNYGASVQRLLTWQEGQILAATTSLSRAVEKGINRLHVYTPSRLVKIAVDGMNKEEILPNPPDVNGDFWQLLLNAIKSMEDVECSVVRNRRNRGRVAAYSIARDQFERANSEQIGISGGDSGDE